MANKIHSIKIGQVKYPIYGEGLLLSDIEGVDYNSYVQHVLVTDKKTGNAKAGVSYLKIHGNNNTNHPELVMSGDINVEQDLYVNGNVDIGGVDKYVCVGTGASQVDVGDSATTVCVGDEASGIYVGDRAASINIGSEAYNVYIGGDDTDVYIRSYSPSTDNVSEVHVGDGYIQSSVTSEMGGDDYSSVMIEENSINMSSGDSINLNGRHSISMYCEGSDGGDQSATLSISPGGFSAVNNAVNCDISDSVNISISEGDTGYNSSDINISRNSITVALSHSDGGGSSSIKYESVGHIDNSQNDKLTLNNVDVRVNNGTITGNLIGNATSATSAGKATKLATNRSLWGNDFDGTANVDGAITIKNGANLTLQSPSDAQTDPGDIVFTGFGGDELCRLYKDPHDSQMLMRFGETGTSYTMLHSGNIKSTLGISDWALAATKPSYTASEVGATPSLGDVGANSVKGNGLGYTYATSAHGGHTPGGFISFGNTSYGCQLNGCYNGNELAFRGLDNGTFTSWKTLAFTSDIPTKLSQLTDDVVAGKYLKSTIYGDYNVDTLFNDGFRSGHILSHMPSGSPYGIVHTLSYRGGSNNTKPDFASQIFIPCGDDSTSPNDMFFRTSLADSWNGWNKVITDKNIGNYKSGDSAKLDGYLPSSIYVGTRGNIKSSDDLSVLAPGGYFVGEAVNSTNPLPTDYASLSVLGNEYYSSQLCVKHDSTRAWIRGTYPTKKEVSNWHELAFTDSNVASATKLQTPRKLWGNYFDGTADVRGDLYSDIWKIIKDSGWNGTFIQSANYDGTSDLGNIYMSAMGGKKLTSFNVWANNSKFSDNVTVGGNINASSVTVSGNDILHSGNIGNYKSGDSDKLGGYGLTRFLLMTGRDYTEMDLNTIGGSQSIFTEIRTTEVTTTNSPYEGYGTLLSLKDSSGIAKMQFLGSYDSSVLYFRSQQKAGADITSAWKTIAFTDSNVASATKLQTPRKLWGNYFDGTADINSIATISGSNTDLYWLCKGSQYELKFGIGNGNVNRGIYDGTLDHWWIRRASTADTYIEYGNVGIGTTSPTERLDVSGNVKANGFIGNASSATVFGSSDFKVYAENSNEINFGGTAPKTNVYFGYRDKDGIAVPLNYYFGSSGGANVRAGNFIKSDSSDSYVLLGGGGHKPISHFSKASWTLFTPAETALTNDDVLSTTGEFSLAKGNWYYAGNGYLPAGEFGNIDLAGCSVLTFGGNSGGAYTQLFITSPAPMGTNAVKSNEILFYNNHGEGYNPGWTRVLTNRNYTDYITDTNYYHTRSYSSGLQISTGTGVSNMYVPYATTSQAGVISTGSQTFAGDKTFTGNVTSKAFYINSDERLKTFGDDIKVDFDELAKLRKSHFVFNDNPTKQEIGVSAQEIQKIYPEIVNETEEGTLSVDYSKLAVVALTAVDELYKKNIDLENRLAKIEAMLAKINIE